MHYHEHSSNDQSQNVISMIRFAITPTLATQSWPVTSSIKVLLCLSVMTVSVFVKKNYVKWSPLWFCYVLIVVGVCHDFFNFVIMAIFGSSFSYIWLFVRESGQVVLVSYRVRYCTISVLSEKGAVVLKTVRKQICTCHSLLKLIETKLPPN